MRPDLLALGAAMGTAAVSKKLVRDRVGGDAYRDRLEARGDKFADPMLGALRQRQDKRKWPRPEVTGKYERLITEDRKTERRFEIRDMHDQRIEARAALCLENPRDRLSLRGIRAEPIHRLGGERDKSACTNGPPRLENRCLVRPNNHLSVQRR